MSLEKKIQYFIFGLSMLMCIFFCILGFSISITRGQKLVFLIITPTIMAIICAGIYQLNITKSRNIDIIFIFLTAFLIRYFLAVHTWANPTNDFDFYYRTALDLANGSVEMIRGKTYTVSYPYLQAFVVFESFLIKIFGSDISVLRVIYSFINAMTCVVIYLIGERYDRKIGLFAGVLMALYISNIVFTSVLTCQHISTFLYYLSFYIFTMETKSEKKTFLKFLTTGILIGLANLMRAIAPPILLAILIFVCIKVFFDIKNGVYSTNRKIKNKQKNKKYKNNIDENIKNIIIKKAFPFFMVIVLLLGYKATLKGFDYYAYLKGYRDQISIPTDIRFKFMVGLNYEGSGYSNSEVRCMFSEADENEKKQLLNDFIMTQVKNPDIFFKKIFLRKLGTQWSGIDASYRWLYGDDLNNIKKKKISGEASDSLKAIYENCYMMQHYYNYIDFSYQIFIMFLASIGFWVSRKSRYNSTLSLYTWIILGYVAVHVFIESQQRYRYFGMPIFFIFASIGIVQIMNIFNKKLE
ncbi:MAG: glycosyltransferase family 39 protein [Clostridia bacterium]|nr:glycosyltransferase family 39 protein [Clostridia bacterium]MCI2000570.1 glycosyltransferase family 39 protein [Clostridia bacterium]MCI2015026.1 glycosyltransferase family 39 protein [Clostridia bacterium]